ncbi:MAG: HesA/MoeB/ThiF family protein [Candidatus Hodarchaeales archaeon]|jgi:adenylyltransferase/sulfurtransferase
MLSEEEKLYFSRQIVLPNFGESGQAKLKQARILVAGVGGLGTFSSLLLAEMGVGYLRIVDRDLIEKTNLHRTPLYTEDDLDQAKVEVAATHLKRLNPSMMIDTHACHINTANIESLLEGIDLVIDALDNFATRRVINRECVKKGIPFIFCGVSGRIGNIAVFNSNEKAPCLACLYHEVNDTDLESCDITGIHPTLLAVMTGLQVHEATNLIIQNETSGSGSLLFVDLQTLSFNKIPIEKSNNCKVCSGSVSSLTEKPSKSFSSVELCGANSFMIVPDGRNDVELELITDSIIKEYSLVKKGNLAITFQYSDSIVITIFRGGNILIRGLGSKTHALELGKSIREQYL